MISKKTNRLAVTLLAAVFTAANGNMLVISVSASDFDDSVEQYSKGGLWSELVFEENEQNNIRSYPVPTSYDISTNPNTAQYFPSIGSQGQIASCAGWASTYYQFTYEVNHLKNEATTYYNTFSPSWTYNYINCGCNIPTKLDDAYFVLEHQGAMLLPDYPHSMYLSSYSFAWSSDLDKMRAALRYRAFTYTTTVYYNSLALMSVKDQISDGKVAVIWTNPDGWTIRTNSVGQQVVVRDSYSEDGHFMAVVGYDDNFSVTVNGQTMTGAFKLANSWGASWGNNGYIWVLYDALLKDSSYGTIWQSGMGGERTPVFGGAYYNENTHIYTHRHNQFSFMDIFECDNYFTETLQFTSYDPWQLEVYGKNGSTQTTSSYYQKKKTIEESQPLLTADTRYLVFDYVDTGSTFNVLSNLSTSWTTTLHTNSSYSTYGIKAKLTDNLGNLIEPYYGATGSINNHYYIKTHYSNLAKGRVTVYDNNDITEDDANMILQYIANIVSFSSLQRRLADYNEDGTVDVSDVVLMLSDIANRNNRSFALYDIIPGTDHSIKDFIEQELDISYNDYINEHLSELNSTGVLY